MLVSLLLILVTLFSCTIIGISLSRLVKLRFNWSINFFIGFAMLMGVVSIASIFFAIGFHLFLITIAISLGLLVFNYKHLFDYLEEVSRNKIEIIFNFTL
ncbi:MAG: hypothetical protein N4A46_10255, partial [Schleiferiaceae bacterium]|nr:hypothetical protein [Schleiferiaceae bacterium]